MTELELRAQMCDIGRRLWQQGLLAASEGNFSARISAKRILCTPSGKSKGHLRPDDLVVVDNNGVPVGDGKPSSEIQLHMRMYAKRPDCMAVVHLHPVYATAYALAGETIPDNLLPEAAFVLGSVATVPFAMPGTMELPDAIEPLLADHKSFLLSHHGAVVMGKDLMDAANRMETLERVAQITALANSLGGARPVPEAAFDIMLRDGLTGELG